MKNLFQKGPSLPTTTTGNNNSNKASRLFSLFTGKSGQQDGSARSIRVTPTLQQSWQRLPKPIQRAYMVSLVCLCCMFFGYRTLRYQNAHVHLDCNSITCQLKIQPVGWKRPKELSLARSQLRLAIPVKTKKDGTFLTDENVALDDYRYDYSKKKGKKKHSYKKSGSYKGPDEEGNYVSYEIILRDKMDEDALRRWKRENADAPGGNQGGEDDDDPSNYVSLEHILPYLHQTDKRDEPKEYRLILRQFRMAQSRRRIRTMTQKITSYIKRRRQKLVVKENAAPSWQGILLLVAGLVGFLLSVLLGTLWEEEETAAKVTSMEQRRRQKEDERRRRQQQDRVNQLRQYGGRPTTPRASGPGVRRRPQEEPPGNVMRGYSQTSASTRKRY